MKKNAIIMAGLLVLAAAVRSDLSWGGTDFTANISDILAAARARASAEPNIGTETGTGPKTLVYLIPGFGGDSLLGLQQALHDYQQSQSAIRGYDTAGVTIKTFTYDVLDTYKTVAEAFNQQLYSDAIDSTTGTNPEQIFIITHSMANFIPRQAVIFAQADSVKRPSSLKALYKNKVTIISLNPLLGGDEGGKKAGWSPFPTWMGYLGRFKELDPAGDFQANMAQANSAFQAGIYDYYTFGVWGDSHLLGVWNAMDLKGSQIDKNWEVNYRKESASPQNYHLFTFTKNDPEITHEHDIRQQRQT